MENEKDQNGLNPLDAAIGMRLAFWCYPHKDVGEAEKMTKYPEGWLHAVPGEHLPASFQAATKDVAGKLVQQGWNTQHSASGTLENQFGVSVNDKTHQITCDFKGSDGIHPLSRQRERAEVRDFEPPCKPAASNNSKTGQMTSPSSPFIKWLLFAVCASLVSCGNPANQQTTSFPASVSILQAPLRIPMPLDKAGHKVDVSFSIPDTADSQRGNLIGLRVLFAPGGSDGRRKVLESSPVKVKLTLHRLEGVAEVPVKLFQLIQVSKGFEPSRWEPQQLPDDVAVSVREYTEYSGKPEGTPDASTYVFSFSSGPSEPGRYRLQLETLNDIPLLANVPAFLVYERTPKR